MKNILLKFFADVNLGDDVMIHRLLKRFPDYNFHVISKKDLELDGFSQYPNFHRCPKKHSQKFETYVLVGGSVLNYNRFSGLLYQINEILLSMILKLKGAKIAVIGANLSEIPRKWYGGLFKAALFIRIKNLELITLRDEYSYNTIKPFCRNNAYLFPDIVFGYPYAKSPQHNEMKSLGISVLCNRFELKDSADIYRKLAEIANLYLRNPSHRVLLFAFDTGQLNDSFGMLQVYRLIENKQQVEMVMYFGDIEAFIKKVAACDCFLPVRFHSLVLSLMLGIPFIPFIYSNKTSNLLDDLGYTGPRYNFSGLSTLDAEEFLNNARFTLNTGFKLSPEQLKNLQVKADGHFDMLEKVLEKPMPKNRRSHGKRML